MANTYLNVGATGSGEANTASSRGVDPDKEIVAGKEGVDLKFKRISAGTGVTLDSDDDKVTINATGGAANAFSTIQSPSGPDLIADSDTDRLVLTSSNGTVNIENSESPEDTINFTVNNSILGLSDTFITSPQSGEVLTYNNFRWENAPASGGGANFLFELNDVSPTGADNGDALVFNQFFGDWRPGPPVPNTLGELSNVSTAGQSNGDVLTYNSGTGTWEPAAAGGGVTIIEVGGFLNGDIDGDVICRGSALITGDTTIKGSLYLGNGATLTAGNNNLTVFGDITCNYISSPAFIDFNSSSFGVVCGSLVCKGSVYNCSVSGIFTNAGVPPSASSNITVEGDFISPRGYIDISGAQSRFGGFPTTSGGTLTVGGDFTTKDLFASGGATTIDGDSNAGNGSTITIGGDFSQIDPSGTIQMIGGNALSSVATNGGRGGTLNVKGNFSVETENDILMYGGTSTSGGNGGLGGSIIVGGSTHFNVDAGNIDLLLYGGNGVQGGLGSTRAIFYGPVFIPGTIDVKGGNGTTGNGGAACPELRFYSGVTLGTLNVSGGNTSSGINGAVTNDTTIHKSCSIGDVIMLEGTGGTESTVRGSFALTRGNFYIENFNRTNKSLNKLRLFLIEATASFGTLSGETVLEKTGGVGSTAPQSVTEVSESIYKGTGNNIYRSATPTTL